MPSLYYGDNLHVLRESIADGSVDLIYLDPPFNSKRDYNLLFKSPKGQASDAQITAFEDTWHWGIQAEREFDELLSQPNTTVAELMRALRGFLGENDMMAYLTAMAIRLLELHRVLKDNGTLYLHCDPTASHYLKVLLDGVFAPAHFMADIIWKRTTTHSDAKRWSPDVDNILCYTKSDQFIFNAAYGEHDAEYRENEFRYKDPDGRAYALGDIASPNPRPNLMYTWKGHEPPVKGWRFSKEKMEQMDNEGRIFYRGEGKRPRVKRYLDEMKGTRIGTIWVDLPNVHPWSQERLGYPTQKPLALLERIIEARSHLKIVGA